MALKWQCCSSLKWLKITTFWAKNRSKMVEIQKKIKSFNSTQKAHGMQKMSIFHWKTNSQRKVELGEEYPSGPNLLLFFHLVVTFCYLKRIAEPFLAKSVILGDHHVHVELAIVAKLINIFIFQHFTIYFNILQTFK